MSLGVSEVDTPSPLLIILILYTARINMLCLIISVITLGAAIAHCAPAPVPASSLVGNSRFTVPTVRNANYVRNGTAALLKAYAKYNLKPTREMPKAFTESLRRRQDGAVNAFPSDEGQYLVPVIIGSQQLNLRFDTGSSDL
jgi:hypothetical protein